ncbi:MAG: outer membrane protein assembly factor BamB [Natronomonas sp.]|jgi:outer membrane protein assembly factor BamB
MRRRTYIALVAAGGGSGCLGLGDGNGDPEPAGTDEDGEPENGGEETTRLDRRWREQLAVDSVNLNDDMAIGDGAVFVGHDGGLAALELADGTGRWVREGYSEFTAVSADDDGVVAVADGEVFEVASESGEIRFSEPVDGSLDTFARAGATADLVFVSTNAGTTVYERGTGEFVTDYDTRQTDVVPGADITALVSPTEAFGVDSETGEQRWRVDSRIGPGGESENGTLIGVDTGDLEAGTVYGHDTADGETLWDQTVAHESTGFVDVAITDGVAVFVPDRSDESTLHALDAPGGTEQWTENLGQLSNPFGPPAVDDGVVVMETADDVRALDAETGETLATADRPFAIRAAVAGEGAFVRWSGETVTAYDL